jgi:hypothetical protein
MPIDEKRPINLVTCRATTSERDELKRLARKYGLAGPAHFFRNCLERFFEADRDGNLVLPIDLKRTTNHDHFDLPKMMTTKINKRTNTELIEARTELIKQAQGYLEDVVSTLEHAIAVQYLIDKEQSEGTNSLDIARAIDEMIDELGYMFKPMDNPGEESYIEMTKAYFDEKAALLLCNDALRAKEKGETK